jgi:PKD repeat protein
MEAQVEQIDGLAGTVAAGHAYADDGIYTARLCVQDDLGGSACQESEITVDNVAPELGCPELTPSTPAPTLQSLAVAGPILDQAGDHACPDVAVDEDRDVLVETLLGDPGTADTHTATIDPGDGTGPAAAEVSGPSGGDPGAVTADLVYDAPGTFTVTVTVTDDDGGTDTATRTVVVREADAVARLVVTKTTNITEARRYEPVPFTITVHNPTSVPATGIRSVQDVTDRFLRHDPISYPMEQQVTPPAGWFCYDRNTNGLHPDRDDALLQCKVAGRSVTLGPGESLVFEARLRATARDHSPACNAVRVEWDHGPTTTAEPTCVDVHAIDAEKTSDTRRIPSGGRVAYEVRFTNDGSVDELVLRLTDAIRGIVDPISATYHDIDPPGGFACIPLGQTLHCNPAGGPVVLAPGESLTLRYATRLETTPRRGPLLDVGHVLVQNQAQLVTASGTYETDHTIRVIDVGPPDSGSTPPGPRSSGRATAVMGRRRR